MYTVRLSSIAKLTQAMLKKLPGDLVIAINKKVGFRLLTKFGEKGAVSLVKLIPLVGGAAAHQGVLREADPGPDWRRHALHSGDPHLRFKPGCSQACVELCRELTGPSRW